MAKTISAKDKQIARLRRQIKSIDRQIIKLIAARAKVTDSIGTVKRKAGYPVRNIPLEKQIFEERTRWAKKLKLDPAHVRAIFKLLMSYSIKRQMAIIKK